MSAAMHEQRAPGFTGKMPAHGDFVTRRLPQEFVLPWDGWLQQVIAESRDRAGDAWLDAYLVCPIWRFALAPGVCGRSGWVGALMPSVDRVGRYFPLTVAMTLPNRIGGLPALLLSPYVSHAWFDPIEEAMLAVLATQGYDAQGLGDALLAVDGGWLERCAEGPQRHLHFASGAAGDTWTWAAQDTAYVQDWLLQEQFAEHEQRLAPMTAWLSRGNDGRPGELRCARGLPASADYLAMLGITAGSAPRVPTPATTSPAELPPVMPVNVAAPTLPVAAAEAEYEDDPADRTVPQAQTESAATKTVEDDVESELARLLGESRSNGES